jgi:hypothetical protein
LHPIQLLLGSLLIEAEACQLSFPPGCLTNSENVVQDHQKAAAINAVITGHVLERSFFILS